MGERNSLLDSILDWFTHPFRTDGNAVNWLLFVGLLMCAMWFWQTVLASIKE